MRALETRGAGTSVNLRAQRVRALTKQKETLTLQLSNAHVHLANVLDDYDAEEAAYAKLVQRAAAKAAQQQLRR